VDRKTRSGPRRSPRRTTIIVEARWKAKICRLQRCHIGMMPYFPLANGMLTGK